MQRLGAASFPDERRSLLPLVRMRPGRTVPALGHCALAAHAFRREQLSGTAARIALGEVAVLKRRFTPIIPPKHKCA